MGGREGGREGGKEGRENIGDETHRLGAELRRLGVGRVSAGPRVQTGRGRERGEQINSVRTGFTPPGPQKWAGPGAGWEEQRCYLYNSLLDRTATHKEKYTRTPRTDTPDICARPSTAYAYFCTHKSVKGVAASRRTRARGEHPFVIAGERERESEREREVTVPCPQHRGKISNSKVN